MGTPIYFPTTFAGLMICKEKWLEFYIENQDRLHYLWDPVQNQNVDTLVQRLLRIFKMATADHLTKWESLLSMGTCATCSSHRPKQLVLQRIINQLLSQISENDLKSGHIKKIHVPYDLLAFGGPSWHGRATMMVFVPLTSEAI